MVEWKCAIPMLGWLEGVFLKKVSGIQSENLGVELHTQHQADFSPGNLWYLKLLVPIPEKFRLKQYAVCPNSQSNLCFVLVACHRVPWWTVLIETDVFELSEID